MYSALTLAVLLMISDRSDATGGIRLCGQKLTRTLMAICRNELCGGYFSPQIDKRNLAMDNDDYGYVSLLMNPTKRDGVATECCVHRCTYRYLKTFCCDGEMWNE
ncbi:unnamed protein product [Toxocara canis]|uniref:Insulin-like domain-containing protein n=1 Tax=Toxocara canis TaxID=6265 RepID=A0A3P7GXE7_TOXCA|nr:unnamed protein product [Toxocara canis]